MIFQKKELHFINSKSLSFLFLGIILVVIANAIYWSSYWGNGWIVGDWLINYEDGGFKRRGLSGSLFFLLQDLTGMKLNFLVGFVQVILYLTFFYLLFRILRQRQLTVAFFTLVISPLTFSFFINDFNIIGRKEIMLFILFAVFLISISKGKMSTKTEIILLLSISVATLFHELIFFYTPYFMLMIYETEGKHNFRRYAYYFLAAFIPLAAMALFGGDINQGQSVHIMQERGLNLNSSGILDWKNDFDSIAYYKKNLIGYALYGVSLFLGVLHFFYFYPGDKTQPNKKLFFGFLFCVCFSLPLFVLGIDWGRWLHIHFTLLLLILAVKLPEIGKNNNGFEKIWSKSNLRYLFIILFLLIWVVHHHKGGLSLNGVLVSGVNKIINIIN